MMLSIPMMSSNARTPRSVAAIDVVPLPEG
jgi:hypothetical protein